MNDAARDAFAKVPEVTLWFWIIKIAATTLGETGGDAVTMSMKLGYLVGTAIFATVFVVAVAAQIVSRRFHPFLFWAVIVATTTVGTTLADLVDRSLGIGYLGGTTLLFALLMATLALWRWTLGSVAVASIVFWAAFILTRPLGATVGDFLDKPLANGGLALSRYVASAVLAIFIVACIALLPQRAERIRPVPPSGS